MGLKAHFQGPLSVDAATARDLYRVSTNFPADRETPGQRFLIEIERHGRVVAPETSNP